MAAVNSLSAIRVPAYRKNPAQWDSHVWNIMESTVDPLRLGKYGSARSDTENLFQSGYPRAVMLGLVNSIKPCN